jgi:hypothetical protein
MVCANNSAFTEEAERLTTQNTKKSLIYSFLACAAVGFLYGGSLRGLSFMAPALLFIASLFFFGILFQRVIAKNSIAGNAVVIVFKYAILAVSLFLISRAKWFRLIDFALGLSLFVTLFVFSFFVQTRMRVKKDQDIQ